MKIILLQQAVELFVKSFMASIEPQKRRRSSFAYTSARTFRWIFKSRCTVLITTDATSTIRFHSPRHVDTHTIVCSRIRKRPSTKLCLWPQKSLGTSLSSSNKRRKKMRCLMCRYHTKFQPIPTTSFAEEKIGRHRYDERQCVNGKKYGGGNKLQRPHLHFDICRPRNSSTIHPLVVFTKSFYSS